MKTICKRVQRRLAGHGPTGLAERPAEAKHLSRCADCYRVMAGLERLDATDLREALAPTGAAPKKKPAPARSSVEHGTTSSRSRWSIPVLILAAVAAGLVVAIFVMLFSRPPMDGQARVAESAPTAAGWADEAKDWNEVDAIENPEMEKGGIEGGVVEGVVGGVIGGVPGGVLGGVKGGVLSDDPIRMTADVAQPEPVNRAPSPLAPMDAPEEILAEEISLGKGAGREGGFDDLDSLVVDGRIARQISPKKTPSRRPAPMARPMPSPVIAPSPKSSTAKARKPKPASPPPPPGPMVHGLASPTPAEIPVPDLSAVLMVEEKESLDRQRGDRRQEGRRRMVGQKAAEQAFMKQEAKQDALLGEDEEEEKSLEMNFQVFFDPRAIRRAQQFLAERARIEGLSFEIPHGHWSNTYIPGDPELRRLHARLSSFDRRELASQLDDDRVLDDGAEQVRQPFDPPEAAALGLSLSADRTGVDGPSRLLVQVGLQATSSHGGRRPAMRVGLILDAGGDPDLGTLTAYRELADSLLDAAEVGDRFGVIVAGRPGGVIPDDGDEMLILEDVLAGKGQGESLGLPWAVRRAGDRVMNLDDPTSPLGTSVLIIATHRRLGRDVELLSQLAHAGAVLGMPLSFVAVGPGTDPAELEPLVLAGQGNLRRLDRPKDAAALVDRELAAVSRVVARAVRLGVRLAPGVQLVEVLGAERLDEFRADRVREAEQAIDQKVSASLGIASDRGQDDEGIQIVIPAFYAGDGHAVLLDLVVPGPGIAVEASVRYKDLVFLDNHIARDSLSIRRRHDVTTPLATNVTVNLLAGRLANILREAGDDLEKSAISKAQANLADHRLLLAGLRQERPDLGAHESLGRDIEMLDQYLALIASLPPSDMNQQQLLVDSLRYAGHMKTNRRPD